jgi:flagellar motor protein MotB
VGHAAPAPQADEDLPTSWELSLIRAIAVSRVLQDSGYDKPIVTFGNGDARLGDLGSKLTFDEKSRLAQRVDILVREADNPGWAE